MKLAIELLPNSSWNNNLRNLMRKDEWDKLRRKVYKLYKNRCGTCSARGKLHCHEIWKFDDQNLTQTLTGFVALCELCHATKHIGFAKIQADRGEFAWEKLVDHYCKVNKCNKSDFQNDYKKALNKFINRSKFEWEVKIGNYKLSEI